MTHVLGHLLSYLMKSDLAKTRDDLELMPARCASAVPVEMGTR
jgi:hypothetical protein